MGADRPETPGELRRFLRADFRRNGSRVQRLTLLVFRVGQFAYASESSPARALRPWWRLVDRIYLQTIVHAELPPQCGCGPGLELPHAGRGVVVHYSARLGEDLRVYHRVTIGGTGGRAPSIGDGVSIGAGAFVFGPIEVGDHVQIGANAVVVKDVEPWATVAGVPAEVVRVRTPE